MQIAKGTLAALKVQTVDSVLQLDPATLFSEPLSRSCSSSRTILQLVPLLKLILLSQKASVRRLTKACADLSAVIIS